jgi:predicted DCC family thiol-disulfide oxidoreductase YuxK
MSPEQNENKAIILFDGVCNLCNAAVQKVIKHDKHDYFRFASLQSDVGMRLLDQHQLSPSSIPDSVVLIENHKIYQYSSAALRIAGKLSGPYQLLYPLLVVPAFIRNSVYKFIAKNRYKWFGKQDACWLPTAELKNKFL